MDVFNPKILDASIRDVASCLSDTQKVDLLLFGLGCIPLPPLPPSFPISSSVSAPTASSSSNPPPYSSSTTSHTDGGPSASTGAATTTTPAARAPVPIPSSASASPAASYTSVGYGLSYTFNTYPSSSSSSSSYGYGYPGYAGYTPHSPAHTLLENGIASVLQVRALPPPTLARARVLRARARMRMRVVNAMGTSGYGGEGVGAREEGREEQEWVKSVRDDLLMALEADPTSADARALLAELDAHSQAQSHSHSQAQTRGQGQAGSEAESEHGEDHDRGDDHAEKEKESERERDQDREEDGDVDMEGDRARDGEAVEPPAVQLPATRGPTGTEKILSPMPSPTLVHPPKSLPSSSRPPTGTSTSISGSGSRTSVSARPPLPHASNSYSSASSHASASTAASASTSHSLTMPPPASPASTITPASFAQSSSVPTPTPYAYKSPAVHIPPTRLSAEVWRLVGTHLSRRDLSNVLYLRHPLALVAAERLAADVEVWFGSAGEADMGGRTQGRRNSRTEHQKGRVAEDGFGDYSDRDVDYDDGEHEREREAKRRRERDGGGQQRTVVDDEDELEERMDDARRATRTAHLLARVIRDPMFASRVRTLRVYFGPAASPNLTWSPRTNVRARARRGRVENASPEVAFQTGMLANALPSLVQLRNVHITGGVDAMMPMLRILQRRASRLTALSLTSPDSPPDLSFLDLRRLTHFSYTITGPSAANTPPASSSALQRILAGAQGTLRSVALLNPYAAVGYIQPSPPQGASGANSSATYSYSSSPSTATAAASASYAGPIGHQQILHPQPPAQSSGSSNAASSSGTSGGYSRHGQSQHGQYPQYPLTHPYAPSPHQHALPSHARSLAPHPHSAHAHSAQTHASAMMSVHALAGGSGGSSANHVGPASSSGASGLAQRDQPGYRPRIAPAPPAGYSGSSMSGGAHSGGSAQLQVSAPAAPAAAPAPAPVPVSLWVFPTGALSIGNLTRVHFAGAIASGSRVFADILTHGRHIETLDIECAPLECTDAAQQFLDAASGASSSSFRSSSSDGPALPLLTNFSFTVTSLSRRYADNSGPGAGTALFPAIAEFLRGRRTLRTLALVIAPQTSASVETQMHTAVGFDASVWGVLPSLQGALRGVRMTYPADLSAGLAGWLVPRSVRALGIVMGESGPLKTGGLDGSWTPGAERDKRSPGGRDWETRDRDRDERGEKQRAAREAVQFLTALKSSMPPGLRFVSLPDSLLSILPSSDRDTSSSTSPTTTAATLVVEHGFPSVRVVRMGISYWTVSRKPLRASAHGYSSSIGNYSTRDASAPPSYESHMYDDRNPPTSASSRGEKEVVELEKWPRHRALYHTSEWLAWYGCEDAVVRDMSNFIA